MKLCELQKEAYAIANSKGWHDRDDEVTFGDRIALVHSELSEALEAYREHGLEPWGLYPYIDTPYDEPPPKPEGVAYELADVVIRLSDMAEHYEVDLAQEVGQTGPPNPGMVDGLTFGGWIAQCHMMVANLYRYSLGTPMWGAPMLMEVGALIRHVESMADRDGIDLDAAIEAKMEYNRGREYRHGSKAL